jgi:transposase
MRKGFDGLSGLVRETFGREPSDGSLFVFVSRRREMLKALYWDQDRDAPCLTPKTIRTNQPSSRLASRRLSRY